MKSENTEVESNFLNSIIKLKVKMCGYCLRNSDDCGLAQLRLGWS